MCVLSSLHKFPPSDDAPHSDNGSQPTAFEFSNTVM